MERLWEMPSDTAEMGTVEWGRRQGDFSKGRLKRGEKLKLLANLGRMGVLEAFDRVGTRMGLVNAYGTDLEGLRPRETSLVRDALDFAEEVQQFELMQHGWRTYYWGMLLGGYGQLSVDREILFCAAILHDVGLASGRSSEPCECCFVVHGAVRCKSHLVGKGHDRAKVRVIADAIGLHLNGYVAARTHGAEAHLLSRGAMCDVFGLGRLRVGESIRRKVLERHPRGNLIDALEIWPGHHLPGSRADFLMKLSPPSKQVNETEQVPIAGE
jgi:hypothetical protein